MKKIYIVLFVLSFILSASSAFANTYIVKKNDTLSGILSDRYVTQDIVDISRQIKKVYPQFVLRPGMKLIINDDGVVLNLSTDKDLIITENDHGVMSVSLDQAETEVMSTLIKGSITSNLFDAVKRSGEDPELAAMLAGIFEWEIDFFKDLRVGDKFAVLVEKKFVKDKYVGYGKILAADFYNQGKTVRAIYYNNGKLRGYFTEEGRGLERGFLRVPMNFARITSRFTDSRLHPVLGQYRPHYGVDYAAPRGTPVMTTASGTVETMSYDKASGNYIAVRHSNGYKTFYLHLSAFNKSIRKGGQVNQGQIIGYVGATGYATGPHLDYRISKNGSWLDPLKFVATPKSLKNQEKEMFIAYAEAPSRVLDGAFPIYAQNATPLNDKLYMMAF